LVVAGTISDSSPPDYITPRVLERRSESVFKAEAGSIVAGLVNAWVMAGFLIVMGRRTVDTSLVDTREVAARRPVSLRTVAELAAEVERVAEAAAAGRVRALGNWSAAQILWHLGRLMEFSFDGFPFRYPWHLRWGAWLLRALSWRWLVALAFRPGFRNPPAAAALEPDAAVSLAEAAGYLRRQLKRIQSGERMTAASPAEGPLSHEQWVEVHLRHAELHLSFLAFPSTERP